MKKLVILLIAAMAFMMVGCFGDGNTELGWTNSDGSAGEVTKVVWTDNTDTYDDAADQTWSTAIALDDNSSLKSVNVLNGRVWADVDTGGGGIVENSNVSIQYDGYTSSNNNIQLTEGNAERYEIIVDGTTK